MDKKHSLIGLDFVTYLSQLESTNSLQGDTQCFFTFITKASTFTCMCFETKSQTCTSSLAQVVPGPVQPYNVELWPKTPFTNMHCKAFKPHH